jgi:methylthioxylose transferase
MFRDFRVFVADPSVVNQRIRATRLPGAGDRAAAHDRTWRALRWGLIAALLVCAAVAAQLLPIGFRKANWIYDYIQPLTARALAIAVAVAAIVAIAISRSVKSIERQQWPTVASWVVGALLLQVLLRSLTPFGLNRMFVSSGANAFYQVTLSHPARSVLHDFDRLRLEWPLHARSNMPGKLLLVYALETISTSPKTLAWLVIFLSNLGGALLYLLVRDLLADRRAALFALVLYLLVPGKLFFFPLLNTVTPTIVLASLWLVFEWIRTRRWIFAVLSGLALFAVFVFEPLPLVVGLLPAAFAIRSLWRTSDWTPFGLQAAACLAAFGLAAIAVQWTTGFNAFAAFRDLGAEAVAFNASAQRPYIVWIVQNLLDFAFAIGICQTVLFLSVLRKSSSEIAEPIGVLTISLAAVLLLTDLAGVNRGEIVRLWIFLACLFQIPAAYACSRTKGSLAIILVAAVTVLQDALGTSMIGFILP